MKTTLLIILALSIQFSVGAERQKFVSPFTGKETVLPVCPPTEALRLEISSQPKSSGERLQQFPADLREKLKPKPLPAKPNFHKPSRRNAV